MTTPIRPDHCFELHLLPGNVGRTIVIRAYDHNARLQDSHSRVDIEVRQGGEVIFPLGQLYVGIPKAGGHSTDSIYAKEAVLSCVAMHPSARGGEGMEYYASYTEHQFEWCEEYGKALEMECESRYRDENGNPRSSV